METLCNRLARRSGAIQFFNDPAAKYLREAWVASKIATVRQADQVMLVPESERWPDFRLRWNKTIWQYEITTADKEGRRVGQEHRFDKPVAFHDWSADLAEVPSAIMRAAQLKANKSYSERVGLVIYSLIGDYDWSGDYGRDRVEGELYDATSVAKDKFCEVWVRWGGRLYLLWDHGNRTELILS
jgi:hypothetical protein